MYTCRFFKIPVLQGEGGLLLDIAPLWGPAGGQDGSTDRRDPPRGWLLAAAGSRAAWPRAILLTKKGRRGVSWLISILLDNINTR